MGGTATLKRIAIISQHNERQHRFDLTLFLPNARRGPAPVFLLLNNRPVSNTDPTRRELSDFWPAEQVIARGYAIAAIQVSDLAPDDKDRYRDGAIRLFEDDSAARPETAWAALAAWAWGASRAMDYFETDSRVDAKRVAVVGHSRGREGGALGRRRGRTVRVGRLQRVGGGWRGADPAAFRRDAGADHRGVSALVRRQVQVVQRPRRRAADRPAHAGRLDGAAGDLRRQRRRRSLVRPARRVPFPGARVAGVRALGRSSARGRGDAAARTPARRRDGAGITCAEAATTSPATTGSLSWISRTRSGSSRRAATLRASLRRAGARSFSRYLERS